MTETYHRRAFLATFGTSIATLAGCGEPQTGGSPTETGPAAGDETTNETTNDGEATGTTGTGGAVEAGSDEDETDDATATSDLNLQEANVVGVAFEQIDDGRYRFDVTLYHDDAGEDGYANWWQVETLDGTRLGRRELSHAHGTREFERSAKIDVPAENTCVVVRGHDQTHEYGGQAIVVNLDAESVVPKRQGSERQSFSEADCPE